MTPEDIILWIQACTALSEYNNNEYDESTDNFEDDYYAAVRDAKKGNARAKKYINEFTLRKLRR